MKNHASVKLKIYLFQTMRNQYVYSCVGVGLKTLLAILFASILIGCVPTESTISIKSAKNKISSNTFSVSSVQIIDSQLVVNGNGFTNVVNVKVDGTAFSENFVIESKTATKIIANSVRAFSFDISKVFNVILSDANASATFPIDFSLCNATLNGKGFDCAAAITDKDVLSYDAASGKWKPRAVSGLNYLGTFNASANPATGPAIQPSGAYYIINASGTIAAIPFSIGDWLVSNGSSWQKIANATAVTSVFGRSGLITPQVGDYSLDMLGDVSFPTAPVAGKVLKFDGTNWVAGDDLSGGSVGPMNTADITDGAVTNVKITSMATSKLTGTISSSQIADGTIVNADINAAAAIDYSKLNIANGEIPAAKISGLPVLSSILAATITDGDTTHSPDANVVFDTFATKLDKTGGTISLSLNVPTPILNTEATTKLYVDTADNLKANKAGDTFSGILTLDNDLLIKGGSNYVTVKGNAASTTYTLTLPIDAGTSNQVLTTNGSGVLSWTTPPGGGGGAPTGAAGGDLSGTYPNPTISGLSADKVGGGAVDNTEYSYLNGVTSAIQTQLNAKEASLPTGGTALQYFAGNKTLQTLNTAAVPESGANYYFTDARVRAATLTGLSGGSGTLAAGDTVLGAFGKLLTTQGDYVSKSGNSTVLGQITIHPTTGVLIVPTPVSATHATNKAWVENLVDTYGHWTKTASDISFTTGNVAIGSAPTSYPLSVNGIIQSASGGFRFPDGTVQTTAAAGGASQWNTVTGSSSFSTVVGSATYAPLGQAGTQYTNPISGSIDDGYYTLNLPYPVNFNGTMYSTMYVGTNSYITFGDGTNAYNSLNATNPPYNKIMIEAGDRNSSSVWFNSSPTSFNIRYEGSCASSPGTSFQWELRGSSANDKQMTLHFISGCGNGTSMLANTTTALQTFSPTAGSAYLFEYSSVTGSPDINYLAGNVGIGTASPSAKLEVAGQIKITGGSPGSGKVLTSDSAGLATWQVFSSGATNLHGLSDADTPGGTSIFLGTNAGDPAVTGEQNTGVGINSMNVVTSGGYNTGIGYNTMRFLTTGSGNTAVGASAMENSISISESTAIGQYALSSSIGTSKNTGIGYSALSQATGSHNIGIGDNVIKSVTSDNNVAIGNMAMNSAANAGRNTVIGYSAYRDGSSGNNNTILGYRAGYNNGTGALTTGSFNILIGSDVITPDPTTSSHLNIGNAIYGNLTSGNIGIGMNNPSDKFVVYNGATTGSYTTSGWMHSSDKRLKHDVNPLEDSLSKILKLQGVEYIFNNDPENKKQLGFIAQDVAPIFPEVVGTDKKGFKSMVYSNLIAPVVEAIKTLYARIVGIEKNNQAQDRQIASKADKTETAALRIENAKLKKENSEIRAYLCMKDPMATICK